MKLSAPPPPPPPPPEPPASGEPPPPEPNNADATAGATAAANPAAEAAPTPGAATEPAPELVPTPVVKPLRWPSWYSGLDATLAALVLVLAFACASFVARNSDVWVHLAAGKRLFAGEYTPGSDPFSYSAADRAWVNHSWLTDAISYLLYGGEGKLLVIVKALIIAMAFGLLLAIRRPPYALWPWAVVTGVAVIAAAPRFVLTPLVVSMLFLAITLYLLFRMPRGTNPWRFPIAIGVTFWLWANWDEWFFLGPLTLTLVLLGDLIQTYLLKSPEPTGETETEPLGRLPDTATLAKALGIGVLACMLTPHHVRIWELPFELVGAEGVKVDPRLRQLLITPYDEPYRTHEGYGYNGNGLAYAILLVAGAAALGFGPGRVRVAHVTLWVGFVGLSLLSISAIPFFAIVAVPLVAAQLNALSQQVELKTWGDPKSRMLLIGSSLGRIVCLLGVCALCVLAYPGWLHPEPPTPAYARRVEWRVEQDPILVQTAQQLNSWRERDQLPPDARGVITSTELANYVAWYAPREKVFINGRYNHHRRELKDYISVRKGLGLIVVKDEPPNPKDASEVLKKVNAEYVAIHANPAEGNRRAVVATGMLYASWHEWSPWFIDGLTSVFGWQPAGEKDRPEFTRLRIDPVSLAFGPGTVPLAEPELKPPLVEAGWVAAFVRPPKPAPVGVNEARGWLLFKLGMEHRMFVRQIMAESFVTNKKQHASSWHDLLVLAVAEVHGAKVPPVNPSFASDVEAMQAAPLLALRAVRRAILEDPDHPEPYFVLGEVLNDPRLPLSEGERSLGRIIAYRQCLDRLPSPENYQKGQYPFASDVALQLALVYAGQSISARDPKTNQIKRIGYIGMPLNVAPFDRLLLGQAVFIDPSGKVLRNPIGNFTDIPRGSQLVTRTPVFMPVDITHETLKKARAYAEIDAAGDSSDATKNRLREIDEILKLIEEAHVRGNRRFKQAKTHGLKPRDLNLAAQSEAMIGEALEQLRKPDFEKDFGPESLRFAMVRVSLELMAGRIDQADALLTTLSESGPSAKIEKAGALPLLQQLEYQKSLHTGEYKTAGKVWEQVGGKGIGLLDKWHLPPLGPNVPEKFIIDTQIERRSAVAREPLTDEKRAQMEQEAKKALHARLIPPVAILNPLIRPLTVNLWQSEQQGFAQLCRDKVFRQWQHETTYHSRRGVLSLLEGDIPAAKRWFLKANRKPPDGWGLPSVVPSEAARYLELIELAERKAP